MARDRTTETIPAEALRRLAVFPLPQGVLFPGVVVPLHLFEPRYRALARRCVDGDRMMALAALQPGYEAHDGGRPPIYPIAGLGEIVAERRLPDGRWDIALRGVCRIELIHELPPDEPYRVMRARRLRETERPGDAEVADRLRGVALQLAQTAPGSQLELGPMFKRARAPGPAADALAALFVERFEDRRALLEELDVGRRLALLEGHLAELLLRASFRGHTPTGLS